MIRVVGEERPLSDFHGAIMKSLIVGIVLLFLVLFTANTYGQAKVDPKAVFDSTKFRTVTIYDSIAIPVREQFALLTDDARMADPGKPFIAGDWIYDQKLPRKRLIVAGSSGYYWFIAYQRGGRGLNNLLLLFRIEEKRANPIWGGVFMDSVVTVNDISRLISNGKIQRRSIRRESW